MLVLALVWKEGGKKVCEGTTCTCVGFVYMYRYYSFFVHRYSYRGTGTDSEEGRNRFLYLESTIYTQSIFGYSSVASSVKAF